jgi:hypothetical protein
MCFQQRFERLHHSRAAQAKLESGDQMRRRRPAAGVTNGNTQNQLPWRHSNQYNAISAGAHCEGIIRHESWCPEQNANVHYAYQAVSRPDLLSLGDQLILHALGVAWTAEKIRPNRGASHVKISRQPGTSGRGHEFGASAAG